MKAVDAKFGHRVDILWIDSASEYGWQREYDWSPSIIATVGIVLKSTKTFITIANSVGMSGSALSPLSIPWCSILHFKQHEKVINQEGHGSDSKRSRAANEGRNRGRRTKPRAT